MDHYYGFYEDLMGHEINSIGESQCCKSDTSVVLENGKKLVVRRHLGRCRHVPYFAVISLGRVCTFSAEPFIIIWSENSGK
jgi:hypothetical protein